MNQKHRKNEDDDDYYRDEERHVINNTPKCQNCGCFSFTREEDGLYCDGCGYLYNPWWG